MCDVVFISLRFCFRKFFQVKSQKTWMSFSLALIRGSNSSSSSSSCCFVARLFPVQSPNAAPFLLRSCRVWCSSVVKTWWRCGRLQITWRRSWRRRSCFWRSRSRRSSAWRRTWRTLCSWRSRAVRRKSVSHLTCWSRPSGTDGFFSSHFFNSIVSAFVFPPMIFLTDILEGMKRVSLCVTCLAKLMSVSRQLCAFPALVVSSDHVELLLTHLPFCLLSRPAARSDVSHSRLI